jgi:hypothetical protein
VDGVSRVVHLDLHRKSTRLLRTLLALSVFVASLCVSSAAAAYPWMIRHGYSGCAPCHADPSGAGPLTAYGRTVSEVVLDSSYGRQASGTPGGSSSFLWGAVELPPELRLGGDFREAFLSVRQSGGGYVDQRFITMRADLYGDVQWHRLRAAASIGYAPTGSLNASLTRTATDNLVSREHWLGVELGRDQQLLLRAGRLTLPFGIRNIEHNFWARQLTRTDMVDQQQHGLSLAFDYGWLRGEAMGIAGNYQIRPDLFRERGYSAFVELAVASRLALGVSSLFTRARRDIIYRVTDYRQAHGLFARYAPFTPLVLLAEADYVYQSLTWNGHRAGFAAFLQTDWEPVQGAHLMLTGEAKNAGSYQEPASFGGHASAVWFFAPHADLRLDNTYQRLASPSGQTKVFSLLLQAHVYL